MSATTKTRIPYWAAKFVSKYEPAIRQQIYDSFREKMAERGSDVLTWDDLHEALGTAFSALRPVDGVCADPRMVKLSLAAHKRGDYLSTKDYLHELRTELAKASAAEASGA